MKSRLIARKTRIQAVSCLALFAVTSLTPASAHASKRVNQPLTVVIAQADAIVVARTTRVPERPSGRRESAEIEITRVLKGDLREGAFTVHLGESYSRALGALQADTPYIFFLRAPDAHPTEQ